MKARWLIFVLFSSLIALANAADESSSKDVLKIARSFKEGGYDKTWHGSGVPEEIRFNGEKILPAGNGTYCCGYTFAVAMRVATARGLLKEKTPAEIHDFQKNWYGATNAASELLCAFAVSKLHVGKFIPFDQAQPGDFCQFWRGKSGHSVIFLSWITHQGQKIGMRYRSSQPKTNGVGDTEEYFKGNPFKPGEILKERTYFCRLNEN